MFERCAHIRIDTLTHMAFVDDDVAVAAAVILIIIIIGAVALSEIINKTFNGSGCTCVMRFFEGWTRISQNQRIARHEKSPGYCYLLRDGCRSDFRIIHGHYKAPMIGGRKNMEFKSINVVYFLTLIFFTCFFTLHSVYIRVYTYAMQNRQNDL